ncbi:MAG TPA: type II toxin-antitoxin system VapC family toxin [Gemmataceae bacterium]|nr:type II toxin-antitoxin system VapC family toxin [Gemmataceae bacterium]
MSLYLLDTDTITLFQQRHLAVMARVAVARQVHQLAVTVITIDESYRGWHARILKARKPDDVADAYAGLAQAAAVFGEFSIIPFPVPAIQRFELLQRLKLNVGSNDLRIAAIALEVGGTVVTRNLRDFRRVPGLACEDWSV